MRTWMFIFVLVWVLAASSPTVSAKIRSGSNFTETSEPPYDFPVPLFKGKDTVYRYYAGPGNANDAAVSVMFIESTDSPDTVLNWYKSELTTAGWQTSVYVPPGYSPASSKYLNAGVQCKKDKVVSTITIRGKLTSPSQCLTEITAIDFPKGLPSQ